MFLDIIDDVRPFGSAFSDDDNAAQFLHAVRFFQVTAKGNQIYGMFRNQDCFGTGSHAGVEGDETGFAAHDFDDGDAVVGEGRIADLLTDSRTVLTVVSKPRVYCVPIISLSMVPGIVIVGNPNRLSAGHHAWNRRHQ